MTIPLIVLAVLATLGGLLGVPYALGSIFSDHPVNYIERTLEPVISQVPASGTGAEGGHQSSQLSPSAERPEGAPPAQAVAENGTATTHVHSVEEISTERLLALISFLIAVSGIAVGWLIFKKQPLLEMPRLLENKYYVDEIYDAAIINPIDVGAREGLWKLFDIGVIDGFLHSLGDVVKQTGAIARRMQAGFVRGYAAIILIGALAVIAFFAFYGVKVM